MSYAPILPIVRLHLNKQNKTRTQQNTSTIKIESLMESVSLFCPYAGCEELTLPSEVNFNYSDPEGSARGSFRLGSTVTQTCDAENGFAANGSNNTVTRLCTRSGWSEDNITCQC